MWFWWSLLCPELCSQMKSEIWTKGWWPGVMVTTFHSPGAQSFMEPEESGGGGGGIWSSLDDSRAVIILAILLSAAAKSPSAIKTFCAGHKTLWSRKPWQKASDWSKCVFNALSLADHNTEVHRADDELKHWAREDDKFSFNNLLFYLQSPDIHDHLHRLFRTFNIHWPDRKEDPRYWGEQRVSSDGCTNCMCIGRHKMVHQLRTFGLLVNY